MESFSSVSNRFRTAVTKKLKLVIHVLNPQNVCESSLRTCSFNAGPRGLCAFFDGDESSDESFGGRMSKKKSLHRTSSCIYEFDRNDFDIDLDCDDVDQRAEIFIRNFRSRLLIERQVSLRLRYCEND